MVCVHIVWSVAALLTTLAYLSRNFIRKQRHWLYKLRTVAVMCASLGVLLAASYVQSSRVGFGYLIGCEQIVSGPPGLRTVSLTFDDGPDPLYTPQVLNTLRQANVKATFFMVGSSRDQRGSRMPRPALARARRAGSVALTLRAVAPGIMCSGSEGSLPCSRLLADDCHRDDLVALFNQLNDIEALNNLAKTRVGAIEEVGILLDDVKLRSG